MQHSDLKIYSDTTIITLKIKQRVKAKEGKNMKYEIRVNGNLVGITKLSTEEVHKLNNDKEIQIKIIK